MGGSSTFDQFTNQYQLSKTLRFELKPIGNTQKMLEDNEVFRKDQLIQEKYQKTKPYFDRLHREFTNETLAGATLSGLEEYLAAYKKWRQDRHDQSLTKQLEKNGSSLRKEVVSLFDKTANQWAKEKYPEAGLKKSDISILFEENIFRVLKERYGKEEKAFILDQSTGKMISIFETWKGFTGYFTKFFETRKNFYKDDGKSTAHATRIIDQNLQRFFDNLILYEDIKAKVKFKEVEENFGKTLSDIFSISFYNQCLLQGGINFYNAILGADSKDQSKKGLNQLINEYRQQNQGEKVSFFKPLDKQILSEKDKFTEEIETENELLQTLKQFYQSSETKTRILHSLLGDFVKNHTKYTLSEIYLSKESLNTISHKWTNEGEVFEDNLYTILKKEKVVTSSAKKKDGGYSFPDFIKLQHVKETLENIPIEKFWKERYYKDSENPENKGFILGDEPVWEQFLKILEFEFNTLFERETTTTAGEKRKSGYNVSEKELQELLQNFKIDRTAKTVVKNFADEVLHIYQMAKYFAVEKKGIWQTEFELDSFYTNPNNGYLLFHENAYGEIVRVYNRLRNYLTKKPYSKEKWKLNFENSTLANGWDQNKESDNFAVILRKDEKYFLGLMSRKNNKIFDSKFPEKFTQNTEGGRYEKMVYKLFPDPAKMFPKVCFSKKGTEFFNPPQAIWDIYKKSEFKKGDTFSIRNMQTLIDFYKECLNQYEGWKGYEFRHLKSTREYTENIGEFFRDVSKDGYKISFQNFSESYINEKNQNNELYLFQIRNKDWNDRATGSKNLHTLYFESLFSEENIKNNFPMKLNGQAEIFYRPATQNLETKKDKQGKEVLDHKRYSENKTFLHLPITLNRTQEDTSPRQFNNRINKFLANNPQINIIGVDRGEKHLAYYSVITQKDKILDSGSLNYIQSKNIDGEIILKNEKEIEEIRDQQNQITDYRIVETGNKVDAEDYKLLLEYKEKKRKTQRQTWSEVEGIKDLKKGYISQVVHKLANLAIEHNAIIVFEDLNMRFKQIRGGIEKSVYQQLEKALIDKLNFLVKKGEKDPREAGHLLKAYQLSAPVTAFKDMGKQTGIIFYTQASYTSRIDPVTGWRPHLYLKYSNAQKSKADISRFSKIEFSNGRFEFLYDVKNFREQKEWPSKTVWKVCSNVERFRWDRKINNHNGGYEHYGNLTNDFTKLFDEFGLDYKSQNILEQIDKINAEDRNNARFFKDFISLFSLVCQIRNTNNRAEGNGNDFIFSPVEPFFDSRSYEKFGKNLPKNGDDNGAYNIARKGCVILQKISDYSETESFHKDAGWIPLYVSHTEWDNYATLKD